MQVFSGAWFARYQRAFVTALNVPGLGRELRAALGVQPDGRLVRLLPHASIVQHGPQFVAEFRTHDKHAKRLHQEWLPIWILLHWFDHRIANRWVPAFNLGFDTLPDVFPAPFGGSTGDCQMLRTVADPGETWGSIRLGQSTTNPVVANDVIAGFAREGVSVTNNWGRIYRSGYSLDTSALGASVTVTGATLSIFGTTKNDPPGNNPSFNVYGGNAQVTAATLAFSNVNSSDLGTSPFATAIGYGSWSTSAYNPFTFGGGSLNNINKTGITTLTIRDVAYDVGGTSPTWPTGGAFQGTDVRGYFADQTGTTNDPKLVVTYVIGAPLTGVSATSVVGSVSVPAPPLTFAQFLATDDREPIVLVEPHPSVIVSGFTPVSVLPLFTSLSVGTVRTDFTGCVGVKFTALASVTVTQLGRWRVSTNTQTHTLRLMKETAGGLTTLATASIDMSTGTAAAFKYATLSPPVLLNAGDTYHVYSSETTGGDQWYDDDTFGTVASIVQGARSVFQSVCGASTFAPGPAGPNHLYGPVNFQWAHTYTVSFPRFFGTADIPGGVYRRIDSVHQDATTLAQGTSSSLSAGQWWYDAPNDTLWIRTTSGANPDTLTVIQVFVTLFLATTGVTLDLVDGDPSTGVLYRPWIIGGVSSVTDQAPDPLLGGNVTISGQLDVMNESQVLNKIFATDGAWRWRNKTATIRYGGNARGARLLRSQYVIVGTVIMTGVAADE